MKSLLEAMFEAAERPWVVEPVAIPGTGLEPALRRASEEGWLGVRFVGPTRAAAWSRVPLRGPTAVLTGQVTASVPVDSGMLGEDLDARGLLDAVQDHRPIAGLRALILGGGGTARAAAVELARAGAAHVTLASRMPFRNQVLADVLTERTGVPVVSQLWEGVLAVKPGTRLVVHATSIGRSPEPDARVPLDLSSLAPGTLVAELLPRPTRLVREAADHGCATLDGMELLVRQCAALVAFWSGSRPEMAPIREALPTLMAAAEPLAFAGNRT
jgi:shikimate dehydrogenase